MSRLQLALALGLAMCLACGSEPAVEPPLDAAERQLIDAYVRLSLLETLRPDYPDSVDAVLDSLEAAWDSSALFSGIDSMRENPFRWEKIYLAINAELTALQKSPDNYWAAVYRPQLYASEGSPAVGSTVRSATAAGDSSASTPESGR